MKHDVAPQFVRAIDTFADAPRPAGTEFGIMGRSNSGKSSFISHALNMRGLARVSKKPGKTNSANFYRIDHKMVWVDLPGYGHART
ncbi:MAG: hypothetical protein GF418_06455, partial [Chitinivibrionales bacterium]|nr:hypothetical protein [Chitinivibrionales bacterium]MBD3395251.1 hypothetical protein [Chitinivibrionales bacterium]